MIDSDPRMPSGEMYYILHYKGKNIEVLMFDNRKEGSKNIKETPFRMCWDILSIKPEPLEEISREEIVDIITEAMIARGYVFLGKQLPHIEVKVKYTGAQH